jgi:hypothetical protein
MTMPSYGQMRYLPGEKTFDKQMKRDAECGMMEKSLKVDTSLQGAKDGQQARNQKTHVVIA